MGVLDVRALPVAGGDLPGARSDAAGGAGADAPVAPPAPRPITLRILGVDPGFSSIGLSLTVMDPASGRLLAADTTVITTEKSHRKLEVRASEDNVRRAREIARALEGVIEAFHPTALCCETQSWPRNAGAATKVAIAWGVIVALADRYRLPILQASPQDVKKAVCQRKDASKEDVIAAVEGLVENIVWPDRKGDFEHAADATAVVIACAQSETMLAIRRQRGG